MGWRSALLLLMVASRGFAANDWLIVPGERVGPVTAGSSEADLRREFGDGAVVRAEIRASDGKSYPGVEVYRDRPGESLAVIWRRPWNSLWWPMEVIPCYGPPAGTECRWHSSLGVRVGTSVEELARLNRKPFRLYFVRDVQAFTAPDWDTGDLQNDLGDEIDLYFDREWDANSGYVDSSDDRFGVTRERITRLGVYLPAPHREPLRNDWLIVPGVRFGPIPLGAPYPPLVEAFGPANVRRTSVDIGEGMEVPATAVFDTVISEVVNHVCVGRDRASCRWRIQGGVPFEGSLEEFQRLNGKPFVFNGCCFDLGGIIISWEGGKLDRLIGAGRARFWVDCGNNTPDLPQGDAEIRSNDRRLRAYRCRVALLDF